MKIDQAGLSPAGTAGKARLDGRIDGGLVTLTSTVPGTTNRFRLLSVPPRDDSAIGTLVATGGGATPVWTFEPKPGVYGAYRVELIVNEGIAGEARQRLVFGIPAPRSRVVPPALNEVGDPTARHGLTGPALTEALARTERNVTPSGGNSVDGWQRSLVDMAEAIEIGNYSQLVVPEGGVCIVPEGQQMLYHGDLEGDFEGDLVEIVDAPGEGGEPTFVPKAWSTTHTTNGALTANVLSRYNGGNAMILTFPASPTLGDEVEVKNVGGTGADEAVVFDGDGNSLEDFAATVVSTWEISNPGFWARWKWDGAVWRLVGPPHFAEVG